MNEELLRDLLHALDLAVVERLPKGGYFLHGWMPDWLAGAFDAAPDAQGRLGGALPFLDHFLPQAQNAWYTGPEARADSGPFAAEVGGEDLLLRASAITLGTRTMLVLERLTGEADTRPILQKAREHLLDTERLTRQIAAVHEPTATVHRLIGDLAQTSLSPDQRGIVERLAEASGKVQAAMAPLPAPPLIRRR